ncbi:MAG TPA: amino acid permease, partial [Longimicrobiaceae bacterium]|nr:amino acid permease [Longimicrobiaceae bacterium]
LWGWAMFWVMHSGIIAAIGMVFASYLAFFLPLDDLAQRLSAVAAIFVLSAVNYVGVKQGSVLQTAFTVGKVFVIVVMVAAGFALGGDGGSVATTAAGATAGATAATTATGLLGGGTPSDFLLALVAGLFAFGGWHMVTYQAGETVDARRTVPRALGWGVAIVTVCYVLLNAVYFYVLPVETVVSSSRIAADAADAVMGFGGAAAMSGLVVFSTFGALAGIVLAGPRVYWAMAEDGLLFRWAGILHPRYATPHRAILLQAVWASFLVMTGTYRALFTRVIYTEWIFFGLMAVGLVMLRRRPGLERDYSVPLYPVLPILFAAASFGIVIHQVWVDPVESATGLGIVLLGLPVFALWRRRRGSPSPTSHPPTP